MKIVIQPDFINLNQLQLELTFASYDSELLYWGYYDGTEWWRNYLHLHSFFEVCYVVEGSGTFVIDNQVLAVEKGDLFLAKPNERHEIISTSDNPLAIYFWSYTLTPKQELQANTEFTTLFKAFIKTDISVLKNQQCISPILDLLNQEISQKEIGYFLNIQNLCHQLIIEVARAFTRNLAIQQPATTFTKRPFKNTVVNTIIRYIQDNYSQPLAINEIATQVHLSERHVSRIFKSVTGTTIKQFVTQLRIDVAKQRLLNQSLSIADIAYEIGYEDQRHFSTVFRKETGSSPSQFRNTGGTNFL